MNEEEKNIKPEIDSEEEKTTESELGSTETPLYEQLFGDSEDNEENSQISFFDENPEDSEEQEQELETDEESEENGHFTDPEEFDDEDKSISDDEEEYTSDDEEEYTSDDEEEYTSDDEEKYSNNHQRRISRILLAILSIILAGVLIVVGIFHIRKQRKDKTPDDGKPRVTQELTLDDTKTAEESDILTETEEVEYENLDNETFEKLSTDFATLIKDKKLEIESKDLVNFVSLLNINKLAMENPELAESLFGNVSTDAYINSVDKVYGSILTNNIIAYSNDNNTSNFIKVSESLIGSQKEKMQIVENYMDQISLACQNDDKDKANEIATRLYQDLYNPASKLFSLDDGTNYALSMDLYMVVNVIGRNHLTNELRDKLNTRLNSSLDISNIVAIVNGCSDKNTKKLTK